MQTQYLCTYCKAQRKNESRGETPIRTPARLLVPWNINTQMCTGCRPKHVCNGWLRSFYPIFPHWCVKMPTPFLPFLYSPFFPCFLSFPFLPYFILAYMQDLNVLTEFNAIWLKTRGLAQESAFCMFEMFRSTISGWYPRKTTTIGISCWNPSYMNKVE